MKKIALLLLTLCVAFSPWSAFTETQSDAERIAELEAQVSALEAQVTELEAELNTAGSAYAPDAAAAEFNGGIVTVAEASAQYDNVAAYYELLGIAEADYATDAKNEVLSALVEDKILTLKAQEYGVYTLSELQMTAIESEVKAEFDANVDYYMDFRFDDSKTEEEMRADTIAYLSENGYSYDAMLAQATADVWRENLYNYVTANVTVSEEDIKAFYEDELATAELSYSADFAGYEADRAAGKAIVWNPQGVRRVQAILIAFDAAQADKYTALQTALSAGETDKLAEVDALYAELTPRAQEVLDRLAAGEDFLALMDVYGEDEALNSEPGRSEGYYVSAQSTIYNAAFQTAAMALKSVGDISGMIQTESGIYILRYAADVASGAVPYEEVAEQLRADSEEEIKESTYNATVDRWIAEANAVYYPERF